MYEFEDEDEERPRRTWVLLAVLVLGIGGFLGYRQLSEDDSGGGTGGGLSFDPVDSGSPKSSAVDTSAPASTEATDLTDSVAPSTSTPVVVPSTLAITLPRPTTSAVARPTTTAVPRPTTTAVPRPTTTAVRPTTSAAVDTTAVETTALETTVVETTVVETTAPETTAPETTVVETTAVETTVVETTEVETTAVETTAPETTTVDTTGAPSTLAPTTSSSSTTSSSTTSSSTTSSSTTSSTTTSSTTTSSTTTSSTTTSTTTSTTLPPPSEASRLPDGTPLSALVNFDGVAVTISGAMPSQQAMNHLVEFVNLANTTGKPVENTAIVAPGAVGGDLVRFVGLDPSAFPEGTPIIGPTHGEELDRLAGLINGDPSLRVIVLGRSDQRGDEATNLEVSQRRADAVAAHLLAQGVDPARVSAIGIGEAQPTSTDASDAAYELNRRAEFVVFGFNQAVGQ